jgi:hypothetical protein
LPLEFVTNAERLGVRAICHEVFADLAAASGLDLAVVPDSRVWRRNYQPTFAAAVQIELEQPELLAGALAKFRSLATLSEDTAAEPRALDVVLQAAYEAGPQLRVARVVGGGAAAQIGRHDGASWLSHAEQLVALGAAEPGLLVRASQLDSLAGPAKLPLLVAFAGGAELAATREWLSWGGSVLMLARARPRAWQDLIAFARTTSGQLLIPLEGEAGADPSDSGHSDAELAELAGFDLVERADVAAQALGWAAAQNEPIVFGHFGYAPGIDHLRLQVVAEILSELAMQRLGPERLQFSWLATPSDSIAVPVELQLARMQNFRNRSTLRKLNDFGWQLLGQLREPRLELIGEAALGMALLDASTTKQGPSYSLAKRTQRWRAQLAASAGYRVNYQVTPPATTHSVLDFRILRATYRGAARYGTHPLPVVEARQWPAALTALAALQPSAVMNRPAEIYLPQAIHGGLWRTPYETDSSWYPATVLGLIKSIGAKPIQLSERP